MDDANDEAYWRQRRKDLIEGTIMIAFIFLMGVVAGHVWWR